MPASFRIGYGKMACLQCCRRCLTSTRLRVLERQVDRPGWEGFPHPQVCGTEGRDGAKGAEDADLRAYDKCGAS